MKKEVFFLFIIGITCGVLTFKLPKNDKTASAKEITWDKFKQQPKIINKTENYDNNHHLKSDHNSTLKKHRVNNIIREELVKYSTEQDDNEAKNFVRSKRSEPTLDDCILPRVPSNEMNDMARKCFHYPGFPENLGEEEELVVDRKAVSFLYPSLDANITYSCENNTEGEPIFCEYRILIINKRIFKYRKDYNRLRNRVTMELCNREHWVKDYD